MGVLSGIEPEKVFEYFEEIASIPHGSRDTKRISDHIAEFARKRSLECIQDEMGNLIIRKPGSPGYEASSSVMLQGHMDMVCEKTEDSDFDFSKDGLKLQLKDGIVTAEDTTLGGDDGIAVAMCMAVLDSEDIKHPPLEVVLTVDEEIGMLGAAALDMSMLKSKALINIDSEVEGIVTTGCAGGVTASCIIPVKRKYKAGILMELKIEGLKGGHSGAEIHKGRANADKLLGRLLYSASREISFELVSLSGGLKDNAIPRSARALLSIGSIEDQKKLKALVDLFSQIISREYSKTDADISFKLTEAEEEIGFEEPMDADSTKRVIAALRSLPNGIQKMSRDREGLVQTSLNLGILKTEKDSVSFSFSVRSSMESEKEALTEALECLSSALGGRLELNGDYPAWEYKEESRLRELYVKSYREQYGKEPVVDVIHAGLECGLFAGSIEGLDAISIGPDMKDIHTHAESMDSASVKRTWELLLKMLEELK